MKAIIGRSQLHGQATVPGSKSATIRAVLFGMLADGTTYVRGPLRADAGLTAIRTARLLGARIDEADDGSLLITGTAGHPQPAGEIIDLGSSGTAMSFLLGISTLCGGLSLTGDAQLRNRSWQDELSALSQLGARIACDGCGHPPFMISGSIHGGHAELSGRNSQHISGIFAPAALLPQGESVHIAVSDPREVAYVKLTERWLRKFSVSVESDESGSFYSIAGGQRFVPCECTVPADWSSAAFIITAAALTDSHVTITGLDYGDMQADRALPEILIAMGADISMDTEQGSLTVCGGRRLSGTSVDISALPDSLPILTVAAACADGDSTFINIENARIKETDRAKVMMQMLDRCGAQIELSDDKMVIHGGKLHGAHVSACGDHRIAMALTVCGLVTGDMVVDGSECSEASFPDFYAALERLGALVATQEG